MKTPTRLFSLIAATCFAFLTSSARAQLLTYESQTGYTGSVITFGASGGSATKGEIFTNVLSVASLSYNFFAGSGIGPGGANTSYATNFSATFGEWSGSSFVGGTTVSFGNFTVPASTDAAWTNNLSITGDPFRNYEKTFDFTSLVSGLTNATDGYVTDPTKAYALMLTNTTGSVTNIGLGQNDADLFSYGYVGFAESGSDWVFSQIVLTPNPTVPEASTVASIIAAIFIAGLVGFRLRQRHLQQLAPVPVVSA